MVTDYRVLVYGGRDFENWRALYAVLDDLDPAPDMIINGGANGADTHGALWAKANKIATRTYRAAWDVHGRAAGPIRNQEMVDHGRPDMAVECPGGRGTADMRARLVKAGIPIRFLADEVKP